MNSTASDLPRLRAKPSGAGSSVFGGRNYMFDPFNVFMGNLITGLGTEHWALRAWTHGGGSVWVDLDATGTTIIDPAAYRHLTTHYLALDTLPVELLETMDELDNLRGLLPGWNGYDVAAPKASSIQRAKKWIRELYTDVTRMGAPWRKPHVAADENGDVTFEWWNGDKGLTIYVSGQAVAYLMDWGPNIVTEMEDGMASTSEQRRTLWMWLMS